MHTAIRLPADTSSAARARRSVDWFAAAADSDPAPARLVTTELVANAVRHGAAPIVLLLRSQGTHLTVEVTDCGVGTVQPRMARRRDIVEEGGFGLALVNRIATEWGVRSHGRGGKTVWACLALEPNLVRDVPQFERDFGLVSERGFEERIIAAQEQDRADVERKLARQADDDERRDWRAAAIHRTAASVHHAAATLHERLACLADQRVQRLFDRYR